MHTTEFTVFSAAVVKSVSNAGVLAVLTKVGSCWAYIGLMLPSATAPHRAMLKMYRFIVEVLKC
jgi:hypothetical protein